MEIKKIVVLYNCEEIRVDILRYSGDENSEKIEEFLQDQGYKLTQIDWACSYDKVSVNYI